MKCAGFFCICKSLRETFLLCITLFWELFHAVWRVTCCIYCPLYSCKNCISMLKCVHFRVIVLTSVMNIEYKVVMNLVYVVLYMLFLKTVKQKCWLLKLIPSSSPVYCDSSRWIWFTLQNKQLIRVKMNKISIINWTGSDWINRILSSPRMFLQLFGKNILD